MPLTFSRLLTACAVVGSCAVLAGGTPSSAAESHVQRPTRTVFAGAGVSPSPGSRYAETGTEISFVGLRSADVKNVVVTGSKTGRHSGRYVAYSTGTGASFVPTKPFAGGERVTVVAPFRIAGTKGKEFSFTVARPTNVTPVPFPTGPAPAVPTQSFLSAPDLHPPVKTAVISNGTIPGDLLTTPTATSLGAVEIDDSSGNLVYYLPTQGTAANLRVQSYRGSPVLTWWAGPVYSPGYGNGTDYIANDSYQIIKKVTAGNGLMADSHEFLITPQGTALITAYQPEFADARSVGGKASDLVFDSVVQEVDIATNRVMFEWHSLDHLPLTDSYVPYAAGTGPYDYAHVNSVNPFGSNELLLSFRNTHGIISIDRLTGQVTRRIGGRRPTVHEPALAGTNSQHDAEPHSDGTITIFDNGANAGPYPHAVSRGLVLKLVGNNVSVKQVLNPPNGELSPSQGNLQELSGGYLIDYAINGALVEYDKAGTPINELHFPRSVSTYRAFIDPWHAHPTTAPTLAATIGSSGTTVNVSWNGATEIASWRILVGPDAGHLTPIATTPKTGFETTLPISAVTGVVQAQALDATGKTLGASTPLTIG